MLTRENSVFTDYKNSQGTFGIDTDYNMAKMGQGSTLATTLRHKTSVSRATKLRI